MKSIAGRDPLQSALRKARWRILPLLSIGYLVAFMDRANISFAAEPMNRDLHFTPYVYGLGAGLFFVSYALCEVPSNWLLLKFGARKWLARIMVTWGLLAMAMLFVRGHASFYGMRLLLGAAEAGYFPGAIYFLSLWFPVKERARAISLFYVALPLSSTVMGGFAGVLLRLDGALGLHGWQWLFLAEGMPALVLGIVMWFTLSAGPSTAKWLDAEEREALEAELASGEGEMKHRSRKAALRVVFRDARVWMLGLFALCMLGGHYALSFFLPELVGVLTGLSAQRVGYLIAASGIVGAAAMLLNAMDSDRTRERRWHSILPLAAVSLLMLYAGVHLHGAFAATALLMMIVGYSALQGPWLAVATELFRGDEGALAIATMNMCGMLGGFAGPYWMGWTRQVTGGFPVGIGSLCVPWLVCIGCLVWVMRARPANVTSNDEHAIKIAPEPASSR
jgi:ACS family tartrate transporter-like MFS transporter